MKSEDRSASLQELIRGGEIGRAIEVVKSAEGHLEAESFVHTVLNEVSPRELVDAVLEKFLETREDVRPEHGYWVHALSHFTKMLWERRLVDWLKKLYKASIEGANGLCDFNCSNRLVGDFGNNAGFDDDPADFGLTPENLTWMDWEYCASAKTRIEAGRFGSEESFLRWKLKRPEMLKKFDSGTWIDLIDVEEIRRSIERLRELGVDTGQFDNLERDLLNEQISELEAMLPAAPDRERERLERGIEKIRAALTA